MNKEVFLDQLKKKLTILSTEERDAAITYYEEYFNDAGLENEQAVINELGSVDKIVDGILNENNYPIIGYDKKNNTNNNKENNYSKLEYKNINYGMIALIILIIMFVAPVIIPIFFAIFGTIIGVLIAGIGIIIAGITLVGVGLVTMFVSILNGLLIFGIGLILFSIGRIITYFMVDICTMAIPILVRTFVKICRYPFKKGGIII